MVVPSDQDGKMDVSLTNDTAIEDEANTRKGGIQPSASKSVSKVVVDIREFRSELPALLHKRGIEIEPVTIVVSSRWLILLRNWKFTKHF